MPRPLIKFRISVKFPERKLCATFVFFIWRLKKEMHAHNPPYGKNYHAITIDKGIEKERKTTKSIEVHLWVRRLSIGYICHEAWHAICYWANRNGIIAQCSNTGEFMDDEEMCASLQGAVVKRFYERLYKMKFIDAPDFFKSKAYPHYGFFVTK